MAQIGSALFIVGFLMLFIGAGILPWWLIAIPFVLGGVTEVEVRANPRTHLEVPTRRSDDLPD